MTSSNEQIWYHNSNVTRATLLFAVNNGNEEAGTFCYAAVTAAL